MNRDTLLRTKRDLRRGVPLSPEQAHAILDEALAASKDYTEERAALKERERQLGIALAQLREVIGEGEQFCHRNSTTGCAQAVEHFAKARYTVDAILDMLKAKGPKWMCEWNWYRGRVEEEFSA
jgi:hypothetical protein